MSQESEVVVTQDGYVRTIRLNRPERMNAFSPDMAAQLSIELIAANSARDTRVVILTGTGRAFCAGLDLKDRAASDENEPVEDIADEHPIAAMARRVQLGQVPMFPAELPPLVLHRMDKPVICALNGVAAGAGMDLALTCDFRIAGVNGRMGALAVKRGILAESGGTWLLPRIVGWSKAARILFTGEMMTATRLLEIGLVEEVVSDDQLMATVEALASTIAANAPWSVQSTKRMMRLGMDETFETAVDHLYLQAIPLTRSSDFHEGLAAFAERREPDFRGN